MAIKIPAPQNRGKRKKFLMENLDYPNAIQELRAIFNIEFQNLRKEGRGLSAKEFERRKAMLIAEADSNIKRYEEMMAGKSEVSELEVTNE